jgi:hypothetical protein
MNPIWVRDRRVAKAGAPDARAEEPPWERRFPLTVYRLLFRPRSGRLIVFPQLSPACAGSLCRSCVTVMRGTSVTWSTVPEIPELAVAVALVVLTMAPTA